MKLSCTKENLYKGLLITGALTGRNASLPILNNVLLKTTDGTLTISSTNLEMGIITTARSKVENAGAITIQGKLLLELVSLLPDERVDLELNNLDLKISCGGHQSVIHGLPAEDFPVIPEVVTKGGLTVVAEDLAEALNQVLFAVNPNESRPEISGVLLTSQGEGTLAVVATDSYRLAEKILTSSKGNLSNGQLIVPLRTVQQLVRIINATEDITDVEIKMGENQVLWQVGETKIISRIITAQFPDYQQIIPKKTNTEIVVDRAACLQAVKSASLFSRGGINDVRLAVLAEKKQLQISAANSQVGEEVSTIAGNISKGGDNEIVFNFRYLLDGLNAIIDKEVLVQIVDNNNPGLIKPVGQNNYQYIIMPIRQ